MSRQALRRIFIPAATVIAAAKECSDLCQCRRTELPIYLPETNVKGKEKQEVLEQYEPNVIEETIGTVRRTITSALKEVKHYKHVGKEYVDDGIKQADWLVKYLGDEGNTAPKAPAIAIGGLTGFILALRGGIIKKVVFTTAGALTMAAICYPKEGKEYSHLALEEGKHWATVGYNFIYGVKKGDPPLELPSLPKIPGSISEAWNLVSEIGKPTKESVSDPDEKRAQK